MLRTDSNGGLLNLTQKLSEPSLISEEEQQHRADQIRNARDPQALAQLRENLGQYVAGKVELRAVDFYYRLERCTPLMLFHMFPRKGQRNQHRNGLQQSYGDHIRLLMYGFDVMDNGDLDWLMQRRWEAPIDVDEQDLKDCIQAYGQLSLSRADKASMWIAGALHDYGKIHRRGFGLDAEDAEPLCNILLDELCDPSLHDFIAFGIRNHDLIEYVVTGETPTSFIARAVEDLPQTVRRLAMPLLGIIQLTGAASLGEGRITRTKVEIYNRCLDGEIIADQSVEARLGRLFYGDQVVVDTEAREKIPAILERLSPAEQELLWGFLGNVVLHDWVDLRAAVLDGQSATAQAEETLIRSLIAAARLWETQFSDHTHVVFDNGAGALLKSVTNGHEEGDGFAMRAMSTRLLNDTRALILP